MTIEQERALDIAAEECGCNNAQEHYLHEQRRELILQWDEVCNLADLSPLGCWEWWSMFTLLYYPNDADNRQICRDLREVALECMS